MLVRTIASKGHIKEVLKEAKIEVSDKLIVNGEDITNQLTTDNIIKTLSSQSSLTHEQINLVKATLNNKEWNTKTKTLSGVGALIVQAVVTYFTAGAGSGLVSSITNEAVKQAVSAAIQSMIVQATTQLATAAIAGNSLKLDMGSIAKGAVMAGVMSYANGLAYEQMNIDVAQMGATDMVGKTLIDTTTQTAIYGGDFKDNLLVNATTNAGNQMFKAVGDHEVDQLKQGDSSWEDGSIKKTLTHSLIGGTIAELQGGEFKAGAISAGARELLSPLSANSSEQTQLFASQLTGILAGGLADGEDGANIGYNVATSAETYNRQLHKDEIALIKQKVKLYAEQNNLSEEQASKELFTIAKVMNDKTTKNNTPILTKEQEEAGFIVYNGLSEEQLKRGVEFIQQESQGMYITDVSDESMKTQQAFTSTAEQFENPYYNLGTTLGLEDQSYMFVPATPVTVTTGKSIFNMTNQGIKVANKIDDDVGRWISVKKDDKFFIKHLELDTLESALPYGTPTSTKSGAIGFFGAQLYDNKEVITENAKALVNSIISNEKIDEKE